MADTPPTPENPTPPEPQPASETPPASDGTSPATPTSRSAPTRPPRRVAARADVPADARDRLRVAGSVSAGARARARGHVRPRIAPAPTPAATPTPTPTPTPATTSTSGAATPKFKPVPTRRAPRKAAAAKVAGIVGMVICALIIVVVWLGLGTVSRAVNDLGTDVNASFGKAIAASDAVASRLDEAVASLASLKADAVELAASSSPDTTRLSGLQARLGQIADRYLEVRVRYAEARENVLGVTSTLSRVARLIPGARVPEGLGDRLAALDSKLQAIDAALASTATKLAEADAGKALADALAASGTPLQDAVSGGVTAVNGVSANLTTLQANADSAVDSIRTVLLIAAIALSVLFVWVLALNIALWLLGRTGSGRALKPDPARRPPGARPRLTWPR